MNGEITVESVPGQGSTFFFTAEFGVLPEKQNNRSLYQKISGMNILVVDDSSTAQQILREMLESFGCEVTVASSGMEALEKVESASDRGKPFKLVLMDYMMGPGLDGLETIRLIRNNDALDIIPATIIVTNYDQGEVRRRGGTDDLDVILRKPLTPSTLFNSIMDTFTEDAEEQDVELLSQRGVDPNRLLHLRDMKILLVEDNEINQQVAMELLTQAGLDVDLACNGLEAVDAFSKETYKLILMDIQMPKMDGYEAVRVIRDLESRNIHQQAPVPIIAMTAHSMVGDLEKCVAAGMDDHVSKPIDPAVLYSAIAKYVVPDQKQKVASLEQEMIPVPATTKDSFQDLPGIDVTLGLARVLNKKKLYVQLLGKFKRDYSTAVEEIALLSEDKEKRGELQQFIHTLKSVAGNVGAMDLHQSVENLEKAIQNDAVEEMDSTLNNMTQHLKQVLSGLDTLAEEEKPAAPQSSRPTGSLEKLDELLNTLRPYLEEGAPKKCRKILAELEGLQWSGDIHRDIINLDEETKRYKFSEALKTLQVIIEKHITPEG